jgi:hypothetical protein
MAQNRLATAALLACAVAPVVGCGTVTDPRTSPSTTVPSGSTVATSAPASPSTDVVTLEQLLAARSGDDPQRFAALVAGAAASCDDPDAARDLGAAAAVAARWADALALARPKVQARTEAQLAAVDWAALLAACARA